MNETARRRIAEAAGDGQLGAEAAAHLERWTSGKPYAAWWPDIERLVASGAWAELNDAFGEILPFGTGGRRGPMGPGPNRINARTIGESAQGLASYLVKTTRQAAPGHAPASVVIAYDTRNGSAEFAAQTAAIVAGNGLKARLFEGPRSTPELSFAVRHLGAGAGVVISASHNPPTDNGFKAYWSDGGQVVPPHDRNIIREVIGAERLKSLPEPQAREAGLWETIGEAVDRAYVSYTAGLALASERDIGVVFSPLHGTGATSVWPALQAAGFTRLKKVESQWAPDGRFPGVPNHVANPEVPSALQAGQEVAEACGADLVLASDPDADRLGVAVRRNIGNGAWQFLHGNQIGALLADHVVDRLAAAGSIPAGGIVYKTLVTTDLVDRICAARGLALRGDLLVGFKYIAAEILRLPDPGQFVFGTEESHGYLRGPAVRDKDAAQAAVLLCERAACARAAGRTLLDDLDALWARHGYFREITRPITFASAEGRGLSRMQALMESLRKDPPRRLGGERVVRVVDRAAGTAADPETGRVEGEIAGTKGNVLVFALSEDGSQRVSIRPSGTEPKIKVYVQLNGPAGDGSPATREAVDRRAEALLGAMESLADERTRKRT